MNARTFLVMAGGTGGHVFPALAVANHMIMNHDKVVWMGASGGMEEAIVAKANIPFHGLKVKGVRGKSWLKQLAAPLVIMSAIIQAIKVIRHVKPDAVLGMGGFASGPGGIAAKIMGVPLVIHEQNSVAGLTNRILARFANAVLTAFPNAFSSSTRTNLVGNPIRAEICALHSGNSSITKANKVNLLVLGGSLGAQALNELIPQSIALLEDEIKPEVWHQAGKGKSDSVNAGYKKLGLTAKVSDFIEDMAQAYQWADFVICRAGALTISEICAARLGAILIPYPHAVDDHQTKNAEYLVQAGAACLLPQQGLTPDMLVDVLAPLLRKKEKLKMLSNAASKLARIDATESVAQECRRACYV